MRKHITIVLPFYNEEKNLPVLYERLRQVASTLPYRFEFLFVNDGSSDRGTIFAREAALSGENVRLVDLARNFGHQTAVLAGLQHAEGDAVVVMDTDLQDRPEAIPLFIEQWEKGNEVVYAIRTKRKEFVLKRLLFASFYQILSRLSEIPIPLDSGLFSLMDRRVVDVLADLPERNRYLPGMRAWAGFTQIGVEIERDERLDGPPRISFYQLVKLATDAIFSFSRIPLRLATALGLFSAFLAVIATLMVLYDKFISLKAIPGWTSTLLSILFLGAVQLISLGILGEYLGRIYEEVKHRPPYVVRKIWGRPSGAREETTGTKDDEA
jgi:glycosyltransferase involved in cell wall biosynthesis